MTTKQDKKPVPFIKAGELIKKVRKDMFTAKNDDNYNKCQIITKESESLGRICVFKAHSLYDNKFGLDKSTERIEKATRLAKRFEREFLKKEEKEKDQLKIIFDLTPIPMGDYITIKHINGNITSIYELKNIQSAIANQCIKLGFDTGKTYSCKVVRKSENQEDTLFIGYLDEIFDVIDFKPLEK